MAAPLAGQLVRASDAFNLVTFTPTYTNMTIGSGATTEGWYQEIGGMVLWGVRVEFAGTPSLSGTAVLMDLPVTAFTGGGAGLGCSLGSWGARDSASVNYGGPVVAFNSGGTQAKFTGAWTGSVPSANVGNTSSTPFTPASGDVFSASGVYRAA